MHNWSMNNLICLKANNWTVLAHPFAGVLTNNVNEYAMNETLNSDFHVILLNYQLSLIFYI